MDNSNIKHKADLSKEHISFTERFHNFTEKYQSLVAFTFVLLFMIIVDTIIYNFVPAEKVSFFKLMFEPKSQTSIDFAPEVWFSLLGLVLGTLIIVISIASQSTPKLIDLYIKDQRSLLYIWFIAIAAAQNLWQQYFVSAGEMVRETTVILNSYIYLPIALLLAIPYILYILRYTKTGNVIDRIYSENSKLLRRISQQSYYKLLKYPSIVSKYQFRIFETLNQMDDLLEYVAFKEPKGSIIHNISVSVQDFQEIKSKLNPEFFKIGSKINSDISFKTLTGQFKEMEETKTFYEQKAFRLLGNAYFKLIYNNDFDLASQCVFELAQCGRAAIKHKDDHLINVIIIRLNTFLRFGIKHGLRNSEVRNLYNAIFYYSDFINALVEHGRLKDIKQSCNYLKIYGAEIYKYTNKEPLFIFLVDVFTSELKKILIQLNKNDLPLEYQKEILNLLLEMDAPLDFARDELGDKRIINDGVRILQVALALFYLSVDNKEFPEYIIDDILEDFQFIGKELEEAVKSTCNKLKIFGPTYWEDTDRGVENIYYTPDKDQIPEFLKMFERKYKLLLQQDFNK